MYVVSFLIPYTIHVDAGFNIPVQLLFYILLHARRVCVIVSYVVHKGKVRRYQITVSLTIMLRHRYCNVAQ